MAELGGSVAVLNFIPPVTPVLGSLEGLSKGQITDDEVSWLLYTTAVVIVFHQKCPEAGTTGMHGDCGKKNRALDTKHTVCGLCGFECRLSSACCQKECFSFLQRTRWNQPKQGMKH